MKKIGLFDWSVICNMAWNKMYSDSYTATEEEIVEFTKLVAEKVLYFKVRFAFDEIILAMDPPKYWRHDLVEEHYHTHATFYLSKEESRTWYSMVDAVARKVSYNETTGTWMLTNVKAKDLETLELGDVQKYYTFENMQIPADYRADKEIPEEITNLIQTEAWAAGLGNFVRLKSVIPYYKGKRTKSKWKGKISKPDWKNYCIELGYRMAPLVQGRAIVVENAEADDVIARAVEMQNIHTPENSVTIISVDQDLYQLFARHNNLTYFNTQKWETVTMTGDQASLKLLHKIVGGDTSDNINGIMLKKRKSKMPTVSYDAEGNVDGGAGTDSYVMKHLKKPLEAGMVGADLYGPVYRALDKDSLQDAAGVPATYWKNLNLVFLQNIPQDLKDTIDEKVLTQPYTEIEYEWVDFGLSDLDRRSTINSALQDSQKELSATTPIDDIIPEPAEEEGIEDDYEGIEDYE